MNPALGNTNSGLWGFFWVHPAPGTSKLSQGTLGTCRGGREPIQAQVDLGSVQWWAVQSR